ncbi:MAG: hypothetical protein K9I85_06635 [Saprospiraceae bacterium]|nr:hypothetical protein [Saprospiraceae bacterium]
MKLLLTPLFLLLFIGCQPSTQEGQFPDLDMIQTLPDLKRAETEVDSILQEDPSLDPGLAYGQLAAKAFTLSRLLDSERLYQKAILLGPESPERSANLHWLASLYRVQLKFETTSEMICCAVQSGEDRQGEASCCPATFPAPDSVHQLLRDRIVVDSLGEFSRQAGREYIAFCQSYALLFPDQAKSAVYLNEGAKLAASMRMPSVAVKLYQWIYTFFPKSEIAPKARFLEGFTQENELKDLEAARASYEGFLEEYPNDVFAKDARILLQNLGVDPEELIRQFQQQQ